MIWDTLAVMVSGYALGALSAYVFMRSGFTWGSRKLYEQKNELPPGERAVEFEQSITEDEE